MKSILLIIPYFGKLPNYFQQFLVSCKYNPTIDFLLFTDDKTQFDYPPNFKVVYCSFEDVKRQVQKSFDFPVELNNTYKLCDYRPAFGEIFIEYTNKYDFWGHCDTDLLFGDIRRFYTESVLEHFNKVGHLGHLTIYKNTPQVNSFYKKPIIDKHGQEIVPYKRAFQKEQNIGFDEWMFETSFYKINEVFMYYREPVYYENHYSDLSAYTRPFVESYYDPYTKTRRAKSYFYYTWSDGKVYAHSYLNKRPQERLYVHFLKRGMEVKKNAESSIFSEKMLIVPNCIELGRCAPSFGESVRIVFMNIINPERRVRLFWVMCGKMIRILRKYGLWKKRGVRE